MPERAGQYIVARVTRAKTTDASGRAVNVTRSLHNCSALRIYLANVRRVSENGNRPGARPPAGPNGVANVQQVQSRHRSARRAASAADRWTVKIETESNKYPLISVHVRNAGLLIIFTYQQMAEKLT